MKTHLSILFLIYLSLAEIFAQTNLVNVVATGEGKTETLAINQALRNAIEKTFGVFISSSTEIKNDELITDQIATVASGNIQKYEIISSIKKENYLEVTVSAQVSPEKIVLNLKKAGKAIELNGDLFAQNIIKEKFYKEQELLVVKDFINSYKDFWIIDSLATFACEPYFATNKGSFDDDQRERYYNKNGFIAQKWDNAIVTKVRLEYLIKSQYPDLKSCHLKVDMENPYERQFEWRHNLIRKSDNSFYTGGSGFGLDQEDRNLEVEPKPTDLDGEFYLLPVLVKPIYNSEKGYSISQATINLLKTISIKDKEDYIKKMGNPFEFILRAPYKNKFMPYREIPVSKNESISLAETFVAPFRYEQFALRNSESYSLLSAFFNQQFKRAGLSEIFIKNPSSFGIINYCLYNPSTKTNAEIKNFRNLRPEVGVINDLLDLNSGYSFPNPTGYHTPPKTLAIYPYIIYLRLSLDDLQNLKKVEIEFKK